MVRCLDLNYMYFIIIEKMHEILRYFNLKFLFKFDYPLRHHRILHCGIENYL